MLIVAVAPDVQAVVAMDVHLHVVVLAVEGPVLEIVAGVKLHATVVASIHVAPHVARARMAAALVMAIVIVPVRIIAVVVVRAVGLVQLIAQVVVILVIIHVQALAQERARIHVRDSVLHAMDVPVAAVVMVLAVLDVIQVATLVLLSRHKQFKCIGGDLIGN